MADGALDKQRQIHWAIIAKDSDPCSHIPPHLSARQNPQAPIWKWRFYSGVLEYHEVPIMRIEGYLNMSERPTAYHPPEPCPGRVSSGFRCRRRMHPHCTLTLRNVLSYKISRVSRFHQSSRASSVAEWIIAITTDVGLVTSHGQNAHRASPKKSKKLTAKRCFGRVVRRTTDSLQL